MRGFGELSVWVGENLSYPEERITRGTAQELSEHRFASLSVMLVCNERAQLPPPSHGLPDSAFLRGDVPMTKAQVRAAAVAALRLQHGWTVWDVGAGTGSISVEIARVLPDGMVYAVEKNAAALELLSQNRMQFGLHNLKIVKGRAPIVLESLPIPDAVFVGGSSGEIAQILSLALTRNRKVRIAVTAITIETLAAVVDFFNQNALQDQEIVQIACTRAKTVGGNRMMLGENPVYLMSAGGSTYADL